MPDSNIPQSNSGEIKQALSLTIPGKVFILGEYLALSGGPAILATTAKGFHFTLSNRFRGSAGPKVYAAFHPDSPAGSLVRKYANEGLKPIYEKILFQDDFEGRGGFGGSTAECIAAFRCFHSDLHSVASGLFWKTYRQIHQNRKVPPSGYDLLVQIAGMDLSNAFKVEKEVGADAPEIEKVLLPRLRLFQTSHLAGRKTKTHEHLSAGALAEIVGSEAFIDSCEPIAAAALKGSLDASDAYVGGGDTSPSVRAFGATLTNYAEVLNRFGFEAPNVAEDRLDFLKIPGVLGAKGCGAMGTDSIIVLTDQTTAANEAVNQLALEKGFNPLKFKYVEN